MDRFGRERVGEKEMKDETMQQKKEEWAHHKEGSDIEGWMTVIRVLVLFMRSIYTILFFFFLLVEEDAFCFGYDEFHEI